MLCFAFQDQSDTSIKPVVLKKQVTKVLSLEGTKTKIKQYFSLDH